MSGSGDLSSRARAIVEHLASGENQVQTARALGLTQRQVRRHCANPRVVAELREVQGAALGDAARRLATGANEMLDVLHQVATSPDVAPWVRVRAAGEWLERMIKVSELVDLEKRITELEQRYAEHAT